MRMLIASGLLASWVIGWAPARTAAQPRGATVLRECEHPGTARVCGTWTYDPATDTIRGVWPTGAGVLRIERRADGSIVLHRTDDTGPYLPVSARYVGRRTPTGYAGTTEGTYRRPDGAMAGYQASWEATGVIPTPPAPAPAPRPSAPAPSGPCDDPFGGCTQGAVAVAPGTDSAQDETDWQRAVAADTREAYQAYQDAHVVSGGAHLEEAEAMLVFFLSLERDDIPAWQEIVDNHPRHPRIAYARRRLAELSADADADGVVNADDACPLEPETVNGVDDGDGCPDAVQAVPPAPPSETVWAPRSQAGPSDVLVAAPDAADADLVWMITQRGEVIRTILSSQTFLRTGFIAAIVVSLRSMPGLLVARSIDGAVWKSADGGVRWDPVPGAPSASRAIAVCAGRTFIGAGDGLYAIERDGRASRVAPGDVTAIFCDAGVLLASVTGRGLTLVAPDGVVPEADSRFGGAIAMAKREGELLAVAPDGRISYCEGLSEGLPVVDASLAGGARDVFFAGGEIYAVHRTGALFRWSGSRTRRWDPAQPGLEGLFVRDVFAGVDGAPRVLAIGNGSHLFVESRVASRQLLVGSVLFETGSAEPRPGLLAALDAIAREWRAGRRIRVEGHTDSVGAPEENMALSRARAQTVRRVLVERGIPDANITTAGYGALRPVAGNAREPDRARNRRVEVLFFD